MAGDKLWYKQEASFWEEALPLGNGRIGAMVFGGQSCEHIQLNEDTLWSGRPNCNETYEFDKHMDSVRTLLKNKKYSDANILCKEMVGVHDSESYQMAGDLYLNFDHQGDVIKYQRELDFKTAKTKTNYSIGETTYTRESFISATDQLMIIKLCASQKGKISFTPGFRSEMKGELVVSDNGFSYLGSCPYSNKSRSLEDLVWEKGGETGIKYVTKVAFECVGGEITNNKEGLSIKNADEVLVLISIETGFKSFEEEPSEDVDALIKSCEEKIENAKKLGWSTLLQRHIEEYSSHYESLKLSISEESDTATDELLKKEITVEENHYLINTIFNYGRYLLISCSREGTQPANLQGIWNHKLLPPWRSNYTTNINLEMNYWPAETCNLSSCAEPLMKFIKEIAKRGKVAAQSMYNARGWCLHHNSDLWRYCFTGGSLPKHAMWPVGGAWICQHAWEHYLFTRDTAFLKEILPIMKDGALFLLDYMIENSRGELITTPSTSPENDFFFYLSIFSAILSGTSWFICFYIEIRNRGHNPNWSFIIGIPPLPIAIPFAFPPKHAHHKSGT